ncbi:hypothetical protein RvY_09715 [Ramazzottius varieornatus]|uniref:Uncharacterized protein n=1 Tax=Ramazzottius varieornatus TaxID=947166 RepID=A0A1D1VJB9_RAMVA|nr:hypothetical protein RvY_09715 [Ramazzottius varieornatus]
MYILAADTTEDAMAVDTEGAGTDTGEMVVAVTVSTDDTSASMDRSGTPALNIKEKTTAK